MKRHGTLYRLSSYCDTTRAEVVAAVRLVEEWGHRREWRGTDPYDALRGSRTGRLRRTRLGRRVAMQVVKRSPVDLRPVLGVSPAHNAAALAHAASAYAHAPAGLFTAPDERLTRVMEWLLALRSPGWELPCWGYHFDVETRVFFYAASTPNTIATSFAGLALLDAAESGHDDRYAVLAERTGEFFLRHVPRTEGRQGAYFGYLPGDRTPIHNANLLVCSLLARLAKRTGRSDFGDAAQRGVDHALAHQRSDGAWDYGERPNLRWVDNFHTGYVLEALMTCTANGTSVDAGSLRRGYDYWRDRCFLADGTPKYYDTKTWPVDAQAVGQAIQTASLGAKHGLATSEHAWRVARWALEHMRRPDGLFLFQRHRRWINPATHVRWVETPMLLGLTHLLALDAGSA